MSIAMIKMPWAPLSYPSLALGLMKSELVKNEIDCSLFYFNLDFLNFISFDFYNYIANNGLLGEWIFSQSLFGSSESGLVKKGYDDLTNELIRNVDYTSIIMNIKKYEKPIKEALSCISLFIDECLNQLFRNEYKIIGFSTVVPEHCASLLLARKIKERKPDTIIIFGGPNVHGIMGSENLKAFDFIDYIVDGEGEDIFLEKVKLLLNGSLVVQKDKSESGYEGKLFSRNSLVDLNQSLIPDYDEYFTTLRKLKMKDKINPRIIFESSRGCEWGEKVRCSFCGINHTRDSFRTKKPENLLKELIHQSHKYGINYFFAGDSMIPFTVLEQLKEELHDSKLNFFYQSRCDLDDNDFETLRYVHVKQIFLGIEAMNTHILQLMKKGVSLIRNIQALKLCSEKKFIVRWNILYGLPGETAADYEEELKIFYLLMHLYSPASLIRVSAIRFSPYHCMGDEGKLKIQPSLFYRYIYPENINIKNLSYYFDIEFNSFMENPERLIQPLKKAVGFWMNSFAQNKIFCRYTQIQDGILVEDNRPLKKGIQEKLEVITKVYKGLNALIFIYCRTIRSINEIITLLSTRFALQATRKEVNAILSEFVNTQLMYCCTERYLTLAINFQIDNDNKMWEALENIVKTIVV